MGVPRRDRFIFSVAGLYINERKKGSAGQWVSQLDISASDGFHGYRNSCQREVSLFRRLTVTAASFLLITTLLVLLIGSAWHVHDHHHSSADNCLWCLAAMVVVVLAASTVIPGFSSLGRRFILPLVSDPLSRFIRGPKASRAPPIL